MVRTTPEGGSSSMAAAQQGGGRCRREKELLRARSGTLRTRALVRSATAAPRAAFSRCRARASEARSTPLKLRENARRAAHKRSQQAHAGERAERGDDARALDMRRRDRRAHERSLQGEALARIALGRHADAVRALELVTTGAEPSRASARRRMVARGLHRRARERACFARSAFRTAVRRLFGRDGARMSGGAAGRKAYENCLRSREHPTTHEDADRDC